MDPVRTFLQTFGAPPEVMRFAPGRVNLIGEHTDYNGGYVLPCALSMGVTCLCRRREDRKLRLYSLDFPDDGIVELDASEPELGGRWTDYPAAVVRSLAVFGAPLTGGADLMFKGSVPPGSGLSSSAALEVATGMALSDAFGLGLSGSELARLGQLAENRFIGVNCGIMDQFASALGTPYNAMLLNTQTLEYSFTPIDLSRAVPLIVNSMVKHSLASSAYNDRRRECEAALSALKSRLDKPTLCAYTPEEFESIGGVIADETVYRRARHVISENDRTLKAAEALRENRLNDFGRLMNLSHASLRDDYEVSCPELDFLAETAQNAEGVFGARMTGGGFGGCTVNLVEPDRVESFVGMIRSAYLKRFGVEAKAYI